MFFVCLFFCLFVFFLSFFSFLPHYNLFLFIYFVILLLQKKTEKEHSSIAELPYRPNIYDIESSVVLQFVTILYQSYSGVRHLSLSCDTALESILQKKIK